jgi:cupin fold WbuC family metalloprotein
MMSKHIDLIGQQTLQSLSEQAKQNPRLRKNQNFHLTNEAQCHRLLNALEPGTYVQPHRHLAPEKDETLIVLSGRIGVLIFDEQGQVVQQIVLSLQEDNFGLTIPVGLFHSMVALETNSVFFEAKAGPYVAIAENERASWAPIEGEKEANYYLENMLNYFN